MKWRKFDYKRVKEPLTDLRAGSAKDLVIKNNFVVGKNDLEEATRILVSGLKADGIDGGIPPEAFGKFNPPEKGVR